MGTIALALVAMARPEWCGGGVCGLVDFGVGGV
jgi:hypothetical protein